VGISLTFFAFLCYREGAEFILLPQIIAFLSLHLNGYKHTLSFLFYMHEQYSCGNKPTLKVSS